jgi:hypothetical protein
MVTEDEFEAVIFGMVDCHIEPPGIYYGSTLRRALTYRKKAIFLQEVCAKSDRQMTAAPGTRTSSVTSL